MKLLSVLLSFAILVFTLGIQAKCPSICINESENSFYDNLCKTSGEVNGKQGCEKYANFGCTYYSKLEVILPESCQNEGGNSFYDNLCTTAGETNGQSSCNKYSTFGCVWYPKQATCL